MRDRRNNPRIARGITSSVLQPLSCNPNLPGTVKLFGAAQQASARKSGARTDTYCVPASLPQKAACYGIGIPTVAELTCVNNHFPSIFFAVPSRSTWLFAVQLGRPVVEFTDTSK